MRKTPVNLREHNIEDAGRRSPKQYEDITEEIYENVDDSRLGERDMYAETAAFGAPFYLAKAKKKSYSIVLLLSVIPY